MIFPVRYEYVSAAVLLSNSSRYRTDPGITQDCFAASHHLTGCNPRLDQTTYGSCSEAVELAILIWNSLLQSVV